MFLSLLVADFLRGNVSIVALPVRRLPSEEQTEFPQHADLFARPIT